MSIPTTDTIFKSVAKRVLSGAKMEKNLTWHPIVYGSWSLVVVEKIFADDVMCSSLDID
jgi:hypothetical protein